MASPEPLVQLPKNEHRTTRLLRLSIFSFVVSTLAVSVFLVAFRFVYNRMVVPAYNSIEPDPAPWFGSFPPPTLADYTTHLLLVVASILLITYVFARVIWDAAEGRLPPPRRGKQTTK